MSKKTKQKKARFTRMRGAYRKAGEGVPAVKDTANRLWVLTVVGTLWASSYVIYMHTNGIIEDIKQLLASALFVLGLMFLFVNLRSVKPLNVVE